MYHETKDRCRAYVIWTMRSVSVGLQCIRDADSLLPLASCHAEQTLHTNHPIYDMQKNSFLIAYTANR